MEWRIRKNARGEFVAEKGIYHKGGEHITGITGVTMKSFIVYTRSQTVRLYTECCGSHCTGRNPTYQTGS